MKGIGVVVGGFVAVLVMIFAVIGLGATSSQAACGLGPGSTASATVPAGVSVPGVDAEQLGNAAIIMNVAASMQLPRQAQLIGVMTALGESSLRNTTEGDGAINPDGTVADSAGLFQQQSRGYGPLADRMDPVKATTAFLTRLSGLDGWETLPPSIAAHRVQVNADPNHYVADIPLAESIVDALTGSTTGAASPAGGCAVSADQVALARELVAALDAGKLVGSTPDHTVEIRAIADGTSTPDCGVDVRILQIIVIAVRSFDQVGVSDINRKCTGQIEGAGTASSHYINGGGHAVDFYLLNGHSLDGTDADTLKLIGILDPVVSTGTNVGQSECRAAAGIHLTLQHLSEFDDTCNHMHVDVGHTDGQLTPGGLLAAPTQPAPTN